MRLYWSLIILNATAALLNLCMMAYYFHATHEIRTKAETILTEAELIHNSAKNANEEAKIILQEADSLRNVYLELIEAKEKK